MIKSILLMVALISIALVFFAVIVAVSNIRVASKLARHRGRSLSELFRVDGLGGRPTGLLSRCGTNVIFKRVGNKLTVVRAESVSTINSDVLLMK